MMDSQKGPIYFVVGQNQRFYNVLTHNCTTTIQIHADAIRPDAPPPLDWRIIFSGHVDELLYDRGIISTDILFAELRKSSRVDLNYYFAAGAKQK